MLFCNVLREFLTKNRTKNPSQVFFVAVANITNKLLKSAWFNGFCPGFNTPDDRQDARTLPFYRYFWWLVKIQKIRQISVVFFAFFALCRLVARTKSCAYDCFLPLFFCFFLCRPSELNPNRSLERLSIRFLSFMSLAVRFRPSADILPVGLFCRSPPCLQQTDKPSADHQTKPTRNL